LKKYLGVTNNKNSINKTNKNNKKKKNNNKKKNKSKIKNHKTKTWAKLKVKERIITTISGGNEK
jgi:hypothetical protein